MALLCATLLLIGWFWLPAIEYRQLGQHAAAALTFVSNLKFWQEAGYFDTASHEKWLLHTWSLSVEWQFYLVYPLLLMGLWRLRPSRQAMAAWLLACFVVSLFLSIILTPLDRSAAFYLLPTRAWEMLAGGLVFMVGKQVNCSKIASRWLELTGFALILGAMTLTSSTALWPGWLALFPVIGAVLVLFAARSNSLWTGTHVVQWLGTASYSIYLWHWPIVVALVYFDLLKSPWAIGIGFLASLALGFISYFGVERPMRKRISDQNWRISTGRMSVMASLIAACGVAIYLGNGIQGRLNPRIDEILAESTNSNPRLTECHVAPPASVPECKYGGPSLGAIVIGDSHAASMVRTVEMAMGQPEQHVMDWTLRGCVTAAGVRFKDPKYGDYCGRFVNDALIKSKSLKKVPLVIVNRTSAYIYGPNDIGRESEFGKVDIYFDIRYETLSPELLKQFRKIFIDTACQFAKERPVYMVRPIPELRYDVPHTMGRAALLNHLQHVSISLEEYHERNRFVWDAQDVARDQCGIKILDPLPYLCHDGRCWGDKDGMPLYYDDDHLSERGAALLLPMFASIFHPALVSSAQTPMENTSGGL